VSSAKWLFTFRGRLGRAAWWLAFLVQVIVVVAAGTLAGLIATGGQPETVPPRDTADPSAVVIMVAAFAVATWISLATSAKRLHDLGVSGWWVVPLYLASTAGSALSNGAPAGSGPEGFLLTVVGLVLTFGPIIYLGAVPGRSGDNRFGPDPRRESGGAHSGGGPDGDASYGTQGGRVENHSKALRDLHRRLDEGAITQEEFDRQKRDVLGM